MLYKAFQQSCASLMYIHDTKLYLKKPKVYKNCTSRIFDAFLALQLVSANTHRTAVGTVYTLCTVFDLKTVGL